ncbi:MAG: hypothetical protein J7K58_02935 [Euryarchaeota archaeon]|nr:hypothetical protein [Euryarchaeota archaeon]
MPEESRGNKDIVLYSLYTSLMYLAKQFLDYAVEINPTSHVSDGKVIWDDYSFNALLNLGTSTLEYGVPSGKGFLLGSLLAQDLFITISILFKEKWPRAPEIEEVSKIIVEWYKRHKEKIPLGDDEYNIVCRGVSFLVRSLVIYSKAVLSRNEKYHEIMSSWERLSSMSVLEIEKRLRECIDESFLGSR